MKRFLFVNVNTALITAAIYILWILFYVFDVLIKTIGYFFPAVSSRFYPSSRGDKAKLFAIRRGIGWLGRGCGAYARIPNLKINAGAIASFQSGTFARWLIAKNVTDLKLFKCLAIVAEKNFRSAVRAAPLWIDAQRALGYMILFQGRRDDAMVQLGKAEALRDKLALRAGFEPDRKVFLPPEISKVMGGIGHIDAYVKHRILNKDQRPYYLLARDGEIVNRPFLEYWRDYITVVTDRAQVDKLAVAEAIYGVGWLGVMPRGDGVAHVHSVIAGLQRQWSAERRAPLLRLRAEHAELLATQKQKWGMTEEDWFICLHIRSSGFHGQMRGGAEDFRNAPLETYYPLIRSIVESGGWVVRMGDSSMPPLELSECRNYPRVIDYAHSAGKTPEMDVALCASCRLFVGQSSGLHTVPHAFGRPCCLVNIPLNAGFPWHVEDLFIPKLYFSTRKNRVLSLEEILSSDIVEADNQFLLSAREIILLPNSADDIAETVAEALRPHSYSIQHEEVGRSILERLKSLNAEYGTEISGRLGRYFATKYAPQLGETNS
jgi:putative glycosyltransferase (TIGR04372 family)